MLRISVAAILSAVVSPSIAQTPLETIRADVRQPKPGDAGVGTAEGARPQTDNSSQYGPDQDPREALAETMWGPVLIGGWYAATTPFWAPRALLNDGNSEATFPRFPYDDCRGYLVSRDWPDSYLGSEREVKSLWSPRDDGPLRETEVTPLPSTKTADVPLTFPSRRWGGQVRADYGDEFADLTSVSGQLILESTSRFGFDASFEHLRQKAANDDLDYLTLGDWSVVYRVAQGPRAQVRMGVGINWLTDTQQTDLGFNFTYAADVFPRKPWVVSTAIDWGTLGHAGLFRFRTTAGVMIHRWEAYTGYEYLDIGTTQSNSLIAGLRVWF